MSILKVEQGCNIRCEWSIVQAPQSHLPPPSVSTDLWILSCRRKQHDRTLKHIASQRSPRIDAMLTTMCTSKQARCLSRTPPETAANLLIHSVTPSTSTVRLSQQRNRLYLRPFKPCSSSSVHELTPPSLNISLFGSDYPMPTAQTLPPKPKNYIRPVQPASRFGKTTSCKVP